MIEDREVTAHQAATLFGIPVGVIYSWKRDRRITPARVVKSRGRLGETWLYRLSELTPLVADYHQQPTRTDSA